MRIPLAPPGYRTAHVQDLSWSEDGKAKAVAVEFRTTSGNEPLYVIYRLEPDWGIEEASQGRVRFTNLLGFYPWPDAAMTDISHHSHLLATTPAPATLLLDDQEVASQRYVTNEIAVDVAFLADASLSVARPSSTLAPPVLASRPYESFRLQSPPAGSESHPPDV